jgi:Asp/Glu/hydantoin racemase
VLSIDQIQSLQKDALINSAKKAVEIDGGDVIIFAGAPLSGI